MKLLTANNNLVVNGILEGSLSGGIFLLNVVHNLMRNEILSAFNGITFNFIGNDRGKVYRNNMSTISKEIKEINVLVSKTVKGEKGEDFTV